MANPSPAEIYVTTKTPSVKLLRREQVYGAAQIH